MFVINFKTWTSKCINSNPLVLWNCYVCYFLEISIIIWPFQLLFVMLLLRNVGNLVFLVCLCGLHPFVAKYLPCATSSWFSNIWFWSWKISMAYLYHIKDNLTVGFQECALLLLRLVWEKSCGLNDNYGCTRVESSTLSGGDHPF